MANICDTEYRIYGPKKDLDTIYETIVQMQNDGIVELDELVNRLGGKSADMRRRGEIRDLDYDDLACKLSIYQNTAWREQSDVRHFLEERFPDITIYYLDEEPGCGWFVTNDMNKEVWDCEYVLDDSKTGTEYYSSIKEIADYINDVYNPANRAEPNEDSIWNVMEQVRENGGGELYMLLKICRTND